VSTHLEHLWQPCHWTYHCETAVTLKFYCTYTFWAKKNWRWDTFSIILWN